jgi:hypothetical protein
MRMPLSTVHLSTVLDLALPHLYVCRLVDMHAI